MNISLHNSSSGNSRLPNDMITLRLPLGLHEDLCKYMIEQDWEWADVWDHAMRLYCFVVHAKSEGIELRLGRKSEGSGTPWHVCPRAQFRKLGEPYIYGSKKLLSKKLLSEAKRKLEALNVTKAKRSHILKSALAMLDQFMSFSAEGIELFAGQQKFTIQTAPRISVAEKNIPSEYGKPSFDGTTSFSVYFRSNLQG